MPKSDNVQLDLNNPIFQEDLLALEKEESFHILGTLQKIKKFTWIDIYKDKGLRWELIQSKVGPDNKRLYTIRISQRFRSLVYREGQFMRFLSLHPDHISAYK